MVKNKKLLTIIGSLVLSTAIVGFGGNFVLGKGQEEGNKVENINYVLTPDYTNVGTAVSDVLKTTPEIQSEIEQIRSSSKNSSIGFSVKNVPIKDVSVEKLLNPKKTQFRLELENKLTNQKSDENINAIAQEYTNNYLKAISIAKNVYGVTVSQEEVTKYIDDNVAPIIIEEKETYAKSLGLTTYELDYVFDRDIYVMDTLWNKLIPVLMEKHPQQLDEDDISYQERIKKEFYSHN